MEESILVTIKKMLGIPEADTAFDVDILANINTTFMVLHQLGVGPESVFEITDDTAVWTDFLTDVTIYSAVKTYIFLKVKMVFDPPGTSFSQDSTNKVIQELEWRLNVQVPIPPYPVIDPEDI